MSVLAQQARPQPAMHIPFLVRQLQSDDADEQAASAAALFDLVCGYGRAGGDSAATVNTEAMVAAGGVQVLLQLLCTAAAGEPYRDMAAALNAAAEHAPRAVAAAAGADGVRALLRALHSFEQAAAGSGSGPANWPQCDASAVDHMALCLKSLVLGEPALADALVAAGGLNTLFSLARRGTACVSCLEDFIHGSPQIHQALLDAGVVPALVAALGLNRSMWAATRTLRRLACMGASTQLAIADAGGIAALVRLLRRNPFQGIRGCVSLAAAEALGAVVAGNPHCQSVAAAAGAIPALVAALGEASVTSAAARALAALGADPRLAAAIASAGGLSALEQLSDSSSCGPTGVREAAAEALASLTGTIRAAEAAAEAAAAALLDRDEEAQRQVPSTSTKSAKRQRQKQRRQLAAAEAAVAEVKPAAPEPGPAAAAAAAAEAAAEVAVASRPAEQSPSAEYASSAKGTSGSAAVAAAAGSPAASSKAKKKKGRKGTFQEARSSAPPGPEAASEPPPAAPQTPAGAAAAAAAAAASPAAAGGRDDVGELEALLQQLGVGRPEAAEAAPAPAAAATAAAVPSSNAATPAQPAAAPASSATVASLAPTAAAAAGLDPSLFADLCCPITQEPMGDPVVASDGVTYERAAIAAWIARQQAAGGQPTSPLTGVPLANLELRPSLAIRSLVAGLQAAGLLSG